MSAENLSVACLGAGYFARFHHDAWQRLDGVSLIACCDSDLARARAVSSAAFDDLGACRLRGELGRETLETHRGSVDRTIALIEDVRAAAAGSDSRVRQ